MRFPGGGCLGPAERGSQGGGRAGMAAAASGTGAAQEKQFPPALLSFFIYNPTFGPREGEVSEAGLRAGVSGQSRRDRGWGGIAGCAREVALARPAPRSTCHFVLLQRH